MKQIVRVSCLMTGLGYDSSWQASSSCAQMLPPHIPLKIKAADKKKHMRFLFRGNAYIGYNYKYIKNYFVSDH